MRLATLLSRSNALHAALSEATGELEVPAEPRATVPMDALLLSAQHSQALRLLVEAGLGPSAMGLLRMQYEAVLRAVWALFAASSSEVAAMAAPLTPGTAKTAKNVGGLPINLLEAVEKSQTAPSDLKRSMREFRTSSWDITNSYVHAGLHPLRRHDSEMEHEPSTALRMSNGLVHLACGLMVIVARRPERQADLNIVCISNVECMPPRHHA